MGADTAFGSAGFLVPSPSPNTMRKILILLALMAFTAGMIYYVGQASHGDGGDSGHVSIARFLFEVVIILLAAKVGGELFET